MDRRLRDEPEHELHGGGYAAGRHLRPRRHGERQPLQHQRRGGQPAPDRRPGVQDRRGHSHPPIDGRHGGPVSERLLPRLRYTVRGRSDHLGHMHRSHERLLPAEGRRRPELGGARRGRHLRPRPAEGARDNQRLLRRAQVLGVPLLRQAHERAYAPRHARVQQVQDELRGGR